MNYPKEFLDNPTVKLVQLLGVEEASKRMGVEVGITKKRLVELKAEHDPYYFDEHCLKIRTKQGKLIPLINNVGQRKLQESITRQRTAGRPIRIKMPKSRQFGGSTKTQAKFFRDCQYEKHIQMLTVCHDLDSARNMRAMFDRYQENYPLTRQTIKKVSEKWWKFKERDIDYLIDTAEELDTGRSFTIHRLHASEVAFYRDPETLMLGLLQAVPDDPNTIVILESTANGMGGWWYDLVMNENDYDLVFVGWHEIEEYTRAFESDKQKIELENNLTDYEKTLFGEGVTLEQLNWRKYTVDNKLNGDEDKFRQEYPYTVEEGFIASGRSYFLVTDIKPNLVKSKKQNLKRGYFEWKKYGEELEFSTDRYGWWKIIDEPEFTHENRYVSGSDPAEGKDSIKKEGSKTDPDYSTCTVFDRLKNKVVARFHARVDTDVFTEEIYKIARYYQTCVDVVELNNTAGGAVIKGLKEKDNVNLYRKETQGKIEDVETVEYGYRTSHGAGGTRETLLSDLRRAIKEKRWIDLDEDFWNEALVFIVGRDGKAQAMQGKHDDIVMSSGLALQGCTQAGELAINTNPVERDDLPLDADVIWDTPEDEVSVIAQF